MVTREEFARVQQIIAARGHSVPHHRIRPEFPLRGCVRCPACKKYMTSSFSRGRHNTYPYYRCSNRDCSSGKSYAAADIHDEFTAWLNEIAPKQEIMADLRLAILAEAAERHSGHRKSADRQKEQASRVSAQIKQLIAMRAQELISNEEFVVEKAALIAKRATLDGASRNDGVPARQVEADIQRILEPLANLPSTWDLLATSERERFHQLARELEPAHARNTSVFETLRSLQGRNYGSINPVQTISKE